MQSSSRDQPFKLVLAGASPATDAIQFTILDLRYTGGIHCECQPTKTVIRKL